MNPFARGICGAALALSSMAASAALPQSGLWGIDSERHSGPGRGIQIDRQAGETVVASYFGYRADGSATFYQAVGKITDGKTLDADLVEYKNGRVLGGGAAQGQVARTVGRIQMVFDTPQSGLVTLPGEQAQRFTPLVYEDNRQRLNNTFRVAMGNQMLSGTAQSLELLTMQTEGDQIRIQFGVLGASCDFKGPLLAVGARFSSLAEGGCVGSGIELSTKKFENIHVDENGVLTMKVSTPGAQAVYRADGVLLGQCIRPVEGASDTQLPNRVCTPAELGMTAPAK